MKNQVTVEIFSKKTASQEAIVATVLFDRGEPLAIESIFIFGEFLSGNGTFVSQETLSDVAVERIYKKAVQAYAAQVLAND